MAIFDLTAKFWQYSTFFFCKICIWGLFRKAENSYFQWKMKYSFYEHKLKAMIKVISGLITSEHCLCPLNWRTLICFWRAAADHVHKLAAVAKKYDIAACSTANAECSCCFFMYNLVALSRRQHLSEDMIKPDFSLLQKNYWIFILFLSNWQKLVFEANFLFLLTLKNLHVSLHYVQISF